MWNIFRRRPQDESPWRATMGWRVLTYQQGSHWLSLQIEPMHDSACWVYVPGPWAWRSNAPAWARDQRETILARLREMVWNRDLAWRHSDATDFWPRHLFDPIAGSLESTPGGRELESMGLFQPSCPQARSPQEAKRAWFAATEQMCHCTSGPVTLSRAALVPGSVLQGLVLPTLRTNPRVRLQLETA